MTETPATDDRSELCRHVLRARAWRSARRWSVERGWPLVLPLRHRRQPVPQPVLARRLPRPARHGAARARWRPWRSRRLPRSIRCASTAIRRPPKSTAASSAPTSSPIRRCWCRPTGRAARQSAFRRRAVARAPAPHGRKASAASAATCRAPAFPSATPGACAPRRRCCWSTAFAFSFGPLGGRIADGFQRACAGLESMPPRIDAWVTPPAYTGKAPVFLTADSQCRATTRRVVHRAGRQRTVAARHRRVGRGDAGLHRRGGHRARRSKPQGAPADAGQAAQPAAPRRPAAASRQFSGKLTRRRHAVAEIRRPGAVEPGPSRSRRTSRR